MRIIAKSKLIDYGKRYGSDAAKQLIEWYQEAKEAEWRTSQDILKQYTDAKIIDNETVFFKICQNKFRLGVRIWYEGQEVYIKFFGTHAEYDRLNAKGL